MKTLRYRGPSHVRSFEASDFAKLGIEADGFSVARGDTVRVSDEVADYLLATPKSWVEFRPRLERDEPAPVELSSGAEADSSEESTPEAPPVDAPETTKAESKSRSRSRDKEA